MMRYKDKSIKFDYYCEEFNEWRDCSVPQWEEDTKYRVKQLNKQKWHQTNTNRREKEYTQRTHLEDRMRTSNRTEDKEKESK